MSVNSKMIQKTKTKFDEISGTAPSSLLAEQQSECIRSAPPFAHVSQIIPIAFTNKTSDVYSDVDDSTALLAVVDSESGHVVLLRSDKGSEIPLGTETGIFACSTMTSNKNLLVVGSRCGHISLYDLRDMKSLTIINLSLHYGSTRSHKANNANHKVESDHGEYAIKQIHVICDGNILLISRVDNMIFLIDISDFVTSASTPSHHRYANTNKGISSISTYTIRGGEGGVHKSTSNRVELVACHNHTSIFGVHVNDCTLDLYFLSPEKEEAGAGDMGPSLRPTCIGTVKFCIVPNIPSKGFLTYKEKCIINNRKDISIQNIHLNHRKKSQWRDMGTADGTNGNEEDRAKFDHRLVNLDEIRVTILGHYTDVNRAHYGSCLFTSVLDMKKFLFEDSTTLSDVNTGTTQATSKPYRVTIHPQISFGVNQKVHECYMNHDLICGIVMSNGVKFYDMSKLHQRSLESLDLICADKVTLSASSPSNDGSSYNENIKHSHGDCCVASLSHDANAVLSPVSFQYCKVGIVTQGLSNDSIYELNCHNHTGQNSVTALSDVYDNADGNMADTSMTILERGNSMQAMSTLQNTTITVYIYHTFNAIGIGSRHDASLHVSPNLYEVTIM